MTTVNRTQSAAAATRTTAAKSTVPTTGEKMAAELRKLAPNVNLSLFGEDDNGMSAALAYRKGPFTKLTDKNFRDVFLKAFGFTTYMSGSRTERVWPHDVYPPSKHKEFFASMRDQYDAGESKPVDELQRLWAGKTFYSIIIDVPGSFRGRVFLVTQMPDKSIVGFKSDIGSMML